MATEAGRTALITGTAQGVGEAISRELLERGYRVAMADWDDDANRRTAARLDPEGKATDPLELDVRNAEACEAVIETVVERFGQIGLLVNNAAVTGPTSLWDLSIDDWDRVLETNLRSVFVLSRAAGAKMRDAGWGRIINISSLAGQAARPSGIAYAASKAGIIGLTRVFALELTPHGVTVNSIAPGVADTPMVQAVSAEVRDRLIAGVPAGRVANPAEIGALVAFLASDRAGFISGATYDINGGTLMR